MPDNRTLNPHLPEPSLRRRVVDHFDEPIALPKITVEAEGIPGADDRRFTIQVRDRLGNPWGARWVLLVWVTLTETGDPGGTQTISVTQGFQFEENTPLPAVNELDTRIILTDTSGIAKVVLNAGAGAGTRYLHALVLGRGVASEAVAWAPAVVAHEWQFDDPVNSDQLPIWLARG